MYRNDPQKVYISSDLQSPQTKVVVGGRGGRETLSIGH